MKTFFDPSALAKRYVAEPGSDTVEEILSSASSLGLSVLCLPELVFAMCRRQREATLSKPVYAAAKAALLQDVSDAEVVQLTPEVLERSMTLLEQHPLRAMDALHLGSAIAWKADVFVSSDKRQLEAAVKSGLKTAKV